MPRPELAPSPPPETIGPSTPAPPLPGRQKSPATVAESQCSDRHNRSPPEKCRARCRPSHTAQERSAALQLAAALPPLRGGTSISIRPPAGAVTDPVHPSRGCEQTGNGVANRVRQSNRQECKRSRAPAHSFATSGRKADRTDKRKAAYRKRRHAKLRP